MLNELTLQEMQMKLKELTERVIKQEQIDNQFKMQTLDNFQKMNDINSDILKAVDKLSKVEL